MLRFEGVHKAYGDKVVLRDLHLTLPQQGVVALAGPSGCGKTTLLRLIAGLEKPDSGQIHRGDFRKISMVFQENRLIPTLTALENVTAVMGENSAQNRERARQILTDCGLAGEEGRYPAQLSGGMERRVALARAVAFGGDLLLLDEPFQALDQDLRRQIMEYTLGEGNLSFRLTLLVTHDAAEMALADQVVEFSGPPLISLK